MTAIKINTIQVGFSEVDILFIESTALAKLPLDKRILSVQEEMRKSNIVISNATKDEFLYEEEHDEASKTRQMIVGVVSSLEFELMLIADNIEEIALIKPQPGYLEIDGTVYNNASLTFIPEVIYDLLVHEKRISEDQFEKVIKSRHWKGIGIDAHELSNKFEEELANWRYYEKEPEEISPLKAALMGKLAGDVEALEARNNYIRQARRRGFLIGEAVGKAHKVNWIATDLKMEHFLHAHDDKMYWVDHDDDVFLLREIDNTEAATSISPLYQQMDYIHWSGFRRGYIKEMGVRGADVLSIFDGHIVHHILANYLADHVRALRQEDNTAEALQNIELCMSFFERYESDLTNNIDFYKAQLIKGDIYMSVDDTVNAISAYESVLSDLASIQEKYKEEVLVARCGSLINLSICYNLRQNRQKAIALLDDALQTTDEIVPFNEKYGNYLKQVITNNRASYEKPG